MQFKKKLKRAFNRFMGSSFVQKSVLAVTALTISVGDMMAASKGAAGFTKATTEISSYQTPVSNLMKAIAAVIALVGAFNVYFKMSNGDQDVKKTIMLTIGGCIAFIALGCGGGNAGESGDNLVFHSVTGGSSTRMSIAIGNVR